MDHSLPILIVEDNLALSKITEKALQCAEYDVFCVFNGLQALDTLRQKFYPIVITDWEMPQMDGLELCRILRKEKFPGYIYIIMLTSRNSHSDIVAGLEAGADQYLIKPVYFQELVARLSAAKRILGLENSLKKAKY